MIQYKRANKRSQYISQKNNFIKMKENRKDDDVVDNAISEAVKSFSSLKEKSKKIMDKVKKEWEESEPDRKMMKEDIKKGSKILLDKSIKLKKDIEKKLDSI